MRQQTSNNWLLAKRSHLCCTVLSSPVADKTTVHQRNAMISPNQIAFGAEVAAIERACRALRSRPIACNSTLGFCYEMPVL